MYDECWAIENHCDIYLDQDIITFLCGLCSSGSLVGHQWAMVRSWGKRGRFIFREPAVPVALCWKSFLLQLQLLLVCVMSKEYAEDFLEREEIERGEIVSSQQGLATQHWSMSGSGCYCRGWERERKRKQWWEKLQHSKYLTLPERVFLSSPQLYCVSLLHSQR